eukprot:TRINITY_DN27538_c0_g1_i2.p2 TRINITY_DN27538_c0_g1~~TRINITY_DN27538_c0_g1_i2.p2  ORF type:complete len:250 (-),score=25.06 TRINITY_DN27538_c0_g1_i2:42-758(-)
MESAARLSLRTRRRRMVLGVAASAAAGAALPLLSLLLRGITHLPSGEVRTAFVEPIISQAALRPQPTVALRRPSRAVGSVAAATLPLTASSETRSSGRLAASSLFGAVAVGLCFALTSGRQRWRQRPRLPRARLAAASMTVPRAVVNFGNTSLGLMLRLSTLNFVKIYMALLVLRITIMWFPNINPYRQPFYSMMQLTDPYLNLFRGWMPPIFGIDLSVILAFVVIQAAIDTLTIAPF